LTRIDIVEYQATSKILQKVLWRKWFVC